MTFQPSIDLHRKLAKALGLGDRPVRRIVIDADVRSAVMVYVQMYAEVSQSDEVVAAIEADRPTVRLVESVDVDERGDVRVVASREGNFVVPPDFSNQLVFKDVVNSPEVIVEVKK